MKKLASQKIDALDYILDGDLEKLSSLIPFLSQAGKTCVIADLDKTETMDKSEFAVILSHKVGGEMKKFAMHDAPNAELSAVLLNFTKDSLPEELVKIAATNLKKSCKKFKAPFPAELNKYAEESMDNSVLDLESIDTVNYLDKVSSIKTAEKYALPEQNKFPLSTKSEVIEARNYFEKYAHEFYPLDAITFSQNVSQALKDFNLNNDYPKMQKFASLDNKEISKIAKDRIQKRYYLISDEAESDYEKLAESLTEKTAMQAVNELATLDQKYKIDRFWGGKVENPAITVLRDKTASRYVSLEDLKELDTHELSSIVGSDAVADITGPDGVEVFSSLPAPLKKAVQRMLDER